MKIFKKDFTIGICLDDILFDNSLPDISFYEVSSSECISEMTRVIFYRNGEKIGSVSRNNIIGGVGIMKSCDETYTNEFLYWDYSVWCLFKTVEDVTTAFNRVEYGDVKKYIVYETTTIANLPNILLDFNLTYSHKDGLIVASTDIEEDAVELMLKL